LETLAGRGASAARQRDLLRCNRSSETASSRFLDDTYGFHKGELPRQGQRLLLTAQYNVNATPHMPAKPFFHTAETGFDPYINRLVLQNSLFPSP
jgi:hypothetical protein